MSMPEHPYPLDPVNQVLGPIATKLAEAFTPTATRDELRGWVLGLGVWLTLVIGAATWFVRAAVLRGAG